MRIVSFHPTSTARAAGATNSVQADSKAARSAKIGALLPGAHEVLDFTSPACRIPQPEARIDWYDTTGSSLQAAHTLYERVAGDEAQLSSLREQGALVSTDALVTAAPVPRPGKLLCIGLNYRDHAAESGMDIPERPLVFSKFSTCVIAPGDAVRIPLDCTDLDYEAEFAIVIGKHADRIDASAAMDHVLGYCCVNDISARDFQFADGQWQRGKSCDTFAPMGPYIATKDEIEDPHALRIQFRRNGETLQDSNTDQLVFGVESLVVELSRHVTLEPGDVISTGTPPGVGFARKPPVWLQDGDQMEVEIEGLGILRNTVRA